METAFRWTKYLLAPLMVIGVITACGTTEVVKEVEVEKIVERQVIKEVPVEKIVVQTKIEIQEAEAPKKIKRNRTLIAIGSGEAGNKPSMWSPYPLGGDQASAIAWMYGALDYVTSNSDLDAANILWLAESWSYNDDFTVLTYKIRDGAAWRDGTPFSADDVAFTLNTLVECGASCRLGPTVAKDVKEAIAIDSSTVEINCSQPCPKLKDFISYKGDQGIYFVPKHVFEGRSMSDFQNYAPSMGWPMSTIPFEVTESSLDRRVLDRVGDCDDWWACKTGLTKKFGYNAFPDVERVILLQNVPDTSAAAQMIIKDQADMTGDLPPQTLAKIVEENDHIIGWGKEKPYGMESWWPLGLMANYNDKHLGNVKVRRAMSWAIDREQLVTVGQSGQGMAWVYPWPPFPSLLAVQDEIADITAKYGLGEFRPTEAAALMEESGYVKNSDGMWEKGGEMVECKILSFGIFNDFGPLLAKQLKDFGVDAEYLTPPDGYGRMASGDYTCGLFGRTGSVSSDPTLSLQLFSTDNQTEQMKYGYSSEEYDKEIAELAQVGSGDTAKLLKETRDVWELYARDLPDIPVLEFFNTPGYNTTHWTNWPGRDNAYMNGIHVHMGFPIYIFNLKAVE